MSFPLSPEHHLTPTSWRRERETLLNSAVGAIRELLPECHRGEGDRKRFGSLVVAFSICVLCMAAQAAPDVSSTTNAPGNVRPHRFENVVQVYEAADKTNPPPRNAILLAGDSQFYRWKTFNEDLPGY